MTGKKIKKPSDPDHADRFVWKPESIVIIKAKPDPQPKPEPKAPKGGAT